MASFSVGAPQPWPPPPSPSSKAYRNGCPPGICSFSCPQWCVYFFAPPPPLLLNGGDDDSDSSSSRVSPLMASLIAVLAAAFLLLFYYTVVSRFLRRRRRRRRESDQLPRIDSRVQDPSRPAAPAPAGLDDSFIRQITVFKYRRGDGLIEGTECAVCLNEFKDDENLRLMPNCEHAYHLPCIDTWLRTHSNCPVCRSTMNPQPVRSSNPGGGGGGGGGQGGVGVAAMQVERSNDAVLIAIRELESRVEVVEAAGEEEGGERKESG